MVVKEASAQKEGALLILNIKRDSSHSFGMTNDVVISTEGRNLLRQESLNMAVKEYGIENLAKSGFS